MSTEAKVPEVGGRKVIATYGYPAITPAREMTLWKVILGLSIACGLGMVAMRSWLYVPQVIMLSGIAFVNLRRGVLRPSATWLNVYRDGIELRKRNGVEFLPWSAIESVQCRPPGPRLPGAMSLLTCTDGTDRILPIVAGSSVSKELERHVESRRAHPDRDICWFA